MTTSHTDEPTTYVDRPVVDETGERIGSVADVVYDTSNGEPTWAVVNPGALRRSRYAPLAHAYLSDDGAVVLSHRKRTVLAAPPAGHDHVLTPDAERDLHQHYGV